MTGRKVTQRRRGTQSAMEVTQSYLGIIGASDSGRLLGSLYAEFLGHSDEVGHRLSLHLVHDTAALNFNRDLTRPQPRSNLLGEPACNHLAHYLAFARREGCETLLQFRNFRKLAAHRTVTVQCQLNCVQ